MTYLREYLELCAEILRQSGKNYEFYDDMRKCLQCKHLCLHIPNSPMDTILGGFSHSCDSVSIIKNCLDRKFDTDHCAR